MWEYFLLKTKFKIVVLLVDLLVSTILGIIAYLIDSSRKKF